jgi:integrase
MGTAWKQTKHEGVRYREHPSRKHGVKPDQYFAIRYRVDGKRREEGLGWASAGWTAQKAAQELSKLKEAYRTGTGAVTLAEKRQVAELNRRAEDEARALEERDNQSFGSLFLESYFPIAKKNKAERSWKKEDQCYRLWIAPVLSDKSLKDIAPIHLERIKKNMADANRAARSITYCLAVVRQVFNFARDHDLFVGLNPVTKIKKPSEDNRRLRFLTHDEAGRLLDALAVRSPDVRDMALLSLHCGLRAGEIFGLEWGDIDLDRSVITIRGTSKKAGTQTKSGKTRVAIMTNAVLEMLSAKDRQGPNVLVFPSMRGGKINQISDSFERTVLALGLNNGVTDSRQKVVFHTLRHTFASWLVEQGVDLYTVKELMGHGNLSMTERYSHLAPDTLRRAVKTLENGMAKAKRCKVVNIEGDE